MKIVRTELPDRVVVLELHGKILIGEGDDAIRDAIRHEANAGVRRVHVDFHDVPYVDSSGLGEIVRCFTDMSRQGGRLTLVGVNGQFQALLAVTKLLTLFEIYDSIEEALKAPVR